MTPMLTAASPPGQGGTRGATDELYCVLVLPVPLVLGLLLGDPELLPEEPLLG